MFKAWLCLFTALTTVGRGISAPINARFLSFSSYLGPVVNLPFDDAAVLRVAEVLRLGSLRYPGGSTSNEWNLTTGRWVHSIHDLYANRTAALPVGTFGPAKYMSGIAGKLVTPPIFDLNVVTDPDPASQISYLQSVNVTPAYLELGNEKAIANITEYLHNVVPVVEAARSTFPDALVSIIGCFGWADFSACAEKLKKARPLSSSPARTLFDAVSIHHYGPSNSSIAKATTDAAKRMWTLAPARGTLAHTEQQVATDIGADVEIWLDEFNWGGPWAGTVWPNETHGGLRGLHWATHVLAAIDVTAEAKAHGRTGFGALMWYSLFYQDASPWSYWASVAKVPNQQNAPHLVEFDAVAQVFAHLTYVAFACGYDDVVPVRNLSQATVQSIPCILAAKFSSTNRSVSSSTVVAVNVCDRAVQIPATNWPLDLQTDDHDVTVVTYSGYDVGGWVLADDIESLMTPPWQHGPIRAPVTSGLPTSLDDISLVIVTATF